MVSHAHLRAVSDVLSSRGARFTFHLANFYACNLSASVVAEQAFDQFNSSKLGAGASLVGATAILVVSAFRSTPAIARLLSDAPDTMRPTQPSDASMLAGLRGGTINHSM